MLFLCRLGWKIPWKSARTIWARCSTASPGAQCRRNATCNSWTPAASRIWSIDYFGLWKTLQVFFQVWTLGSSQAWRKFGRKFLCEKPCLWIKRTRLCACAGSLGTQFSCSWKCCSFYSAVVKRLALSDGSPKETCLNNVFILFTLKMKCSNRYSENFIDFSQKKIKLPL